MGYVPRLMVIYGHQFIEGDFIYCTMFYLWHMCWRCQVSTTVNTSSGGGGIAGVAPSTAMRGLSALRQSGVPMLMAPYGTNNFNFHWGVESVG